jgi:hypothetical protein
MSPVREPRDLARMSLAVVPRKMFVPKKTLLAEHGPRCSAPPVSLAPFPTFMAR